MENENAVGLNDGGRESEPPFFRWSALVPLLRGQRLREQTAGVGTRFFGGYRRFFAPSKKWGYIINKNNGGSKPPPYINFTNPSQPVRDYPSSTIFDGPPPPLRRYKTSESPPLEGRCQFHPVKFSL